MQNTTQLLNELAKKFEPISDNISDEKAQELEWFMKLEAVKAINDENKEEFNYLLQNNDMGKFLEFYIKYVPDYQEKLLNYLKEN